MIEPKKLEESPDFFWYNVWDDKCHEDNWELIEMISAELVKNEPDHIEYEIKYKQCENGETTIETDYCSFSRKAINQIIEAGS